MVGEEQVELTVSVGAAEYLGRDESFDALMERTRGLAKVRCEALWAALTFTTSPLESMLVTPARLRIM